MGMIKNDGICIDGDEGWFIGRDDAILYKINMTDLKVEPKCRLHCEDSHTFREYQKCVVHEDYIVCLPDREKVIMIYNKVNKEIKNIIIRENCERLAFLDAWSFENFIWCISYGMSKLFKIDVRNRHYTIYDIFNNETDKCGYEAFMLGEDIYIACRNNPKIVIFNLTTSKKREYLLGIEDNGINTICPVSETEIYLTGYKEHIYCFDGKNVQCIDIPTDCLFYTGKTKNSSKGAIFYKSYFTKGELVLIPWNISDYKSDSIILYNIALKKVYERKINELRREKEYGEYFTFECVYNDCIFLFDNKTEKFLCINREIGTARELSVAFDDNISKDLLNILWEDGQVWKETGLKGEDMIFLRAIRLGKKERGKDSIGREIWESIRK